MYILSYIHEFNYSSQRKVAAIGHHKATLDNITSRKHKHISTYTARLRMRKSFAVSPAVFVRGGGGRGGGGGGAGGQGEAQGREGAGDGAAGPTVLAKRGATLAGSALSRGLVGEGRQQGGKQFLLPGLSP